MNLEAKTETAKVDITLFHLVHFPVLHSGQMGGPTTETDHKTVSSRRPSIYLVKISKITQE